MAKILCSLSGLEYTCEHFPATLKGRETYHPVFDIPQRDLFPYLRKWMGGELTPTDSYLLFLALLKSTDYVQFRVPVFRTPFTASIVAQNMEKLATTAMHMNAVSSPTFLFPTYVISADTRNLSNVQHWIENWEDSYQEFLNGSRQYIKDREIARRESAIRRLILSPHRPISSYATSLADWASEAGSFPTFLLTSPLSPLPMTCAEYWKQIISRSARGIAIFSVPIKDIEELLEHCEINIPLGSEASHTLFKLVKAALQRRKTFMSMGDADLSKTSYSLLDDLTSAESANMEAIIQAAPSEEPKREAYPSKFEYMKAKMRWDVAVANKEVGQ